MHAYLNWMLYKAFRPIISLFQLQNMTIHSSFSSILIHVRSHEWIWCNKTAVIATGFCSSNLPDPIEKHSSLILLKCCKCGFIRALTLDVYHFIWQSVFIGCLEYKGPPSGASSAKQSPAPQHKILKSTHDERWGPRLCI